MVASVRPQAGLALLHRHGDDCLLHEALAVRSGMNYVLRSDVVFKEWRAETARSFPEFTAASPLHR